MEKKGNKIIIYNTEDGKAKIEVRLDNETVWLSRKQMADLFDRSADNISLHLKNIFNEAELSENSVAEEYSVTAAGGLTGFKGNYITASDIRIAKNCHSEIFLNTYLYG